ncbi:MAG: hypothetical protein KDD40_03980 [Bdellovibrionales bacterium]|nr:hypothetical protein [Bdellovibrionales bacterium]
MSKSTHLWHDHHSSPITDILFITVYRFFAVPLLIFSTIILAILGHKKIRAGLKMRWPQKDRHPWFDLPKNKKPLWIHCASGEFEYAKPLITKIKQKHPDWQILVTYFSPTYKKNIENFPGVDMSCPLPWDTPGAISAFIRHHQPKVLLISRTDLWPELLYQFKKRNLPTILFSCTLGKSKNYFLRKYWQWLYGFFSVIYCVSQEDKVNFLELGVPWVSVMGDTRYDQVFARLENSKKLKKFLYDTSLQSEITLVSGSTWMEDEKVLLAGCAAFVQNQQMRLIIAPHEPDEEHLEKLITQLNDYNLKYQKYSLAQHWHADEILIIDQIGILAELYSFGQLAFIGGSFKKSVHSVMEALAAGAVTFVGPHHTNNREALIFKNQILEHLPNYHFVNTVNDSESLKRDLFKMISHSLQIESAQKQITALIKTYQGATVHVLKWLEKMEIE